MTRAEKAALPRPLRLRALLARRGIKHEEVCAAIRQADGSPLSRASFSQWLNKGRTLVRTPMEAVEEQVRKFMHARRFTAAEIETAFDPDETDRVFERVSLPPAPPADPAIKPVETAVLNQKARQHFELTTHPFPPDQSEITGPDDVMDWQNNLYVAKAMLSAATSGGLLAVIGESGAGKSVLRRRFLLETAPQRHDLRVIQTKTIDKRRLNASALCEAIIRDLTPGDTLRSSLEARARQVETALRELFRTGVRAVLLIEEAHDMTVDSLRFLKRFWEIECGWSRPLAILMFAQPEMKARLSESETPHLREFIRRCEVAEMLPIDDRIRDYLSFKLRRAGVAYERVFSADAADAIRERLSVSTRDGHRSLCYPLVINNLVVHALNGAALAGEARVSAEVIKNTRALK